MFHKLSVAWKVESKFVPTQNRLAPATHVHRASRPVHPAFSSSGFLHLILLPPDRIRSPSIPSPALQQTVHYLRLELFPFHGFESLLEKMSLQAATQSQGLLPG